MHPKELLQLFRTRTAAEAAYVELSTFLRTAGSDAITEFVSAALDSEPSGGTFVDAALSYVAESDFAGLVKDSITRLRSDAANEAAESVIAYASLQLPHTLQPHLQQLFALRPNRQTYFENWPWRVAGELDIAFLSREVRSASDDIREKALDCLIEARRDDAFRTAIDAAKGMGLAGEVSTFLDAAGFDSQLRPRYERSCKHIVFPPGYFIEQRPPWASREAHPTWRLEGPDTEYRLGGPGTSSCGLCGGSLHHLITLPASSVFGLGGDAVTVPLEVCLSCLGYERPVLSYRHTLDGLVEALDIGSARPEFVADPLYATTVRLAPTPARWSWQDWGLSNSRENLNRIGGHPCWIQSADWPNCAACGNDMGFFMQLDSDLRMSGNGSWLWGSGGICYAFRCPRCLVTAYSWQCT
ncbi:MAG TPA: hypothetical protein VH814_10790 [Steroidobacteraceae bacterium]